MPQPRRLVYGVSKGQTRSYLNHVGVAFPNDDGTIKVILHAFPLSGHLVIEAGAVDVEQAASTPTDSGDA